MVGRAQLRLQVGTAAGYLGEAQRTVGHLTRVLRTSDHLLLLLQHCPLLNSSPEPRLELVGDVAGDGLAYFGESGRAFRVGCALHHLLQLPQLLLVVPEVLLFEIGAEDEPLGRWVCGRAELQVQCVFVGDGLLLLFLLRIR